MLQNNSQEQFSQDSSLQDSSLQDKSLFSGNIFIFHAYDVGDDINLESIRKQNILTKKPLVLSKYFKNYHIPLAIEHLNPNNSPNLVSTKLHNFGVISLTYKIPFSSTLEDLKIKINNLENNYLEQSVIDAGILFKKIKDHVKQAKFFHLRKNYVLIQVDPVKTLTDVVKLKSLHGNTIASILRFENETLSEYQKNEILDSAIGYYRGDLIIVDTEAAFIYDDEYHDILDLFEFVNMQQLELQYFDRVLDQQLNTVYEREIKSLPIKSYIPFIGALSSDPVGDLSKLKVDISVITERLENSIKLSGEAYYSELYTLLIEKFELKIWRDSINRKLDLIKDIRSVYENRVNTIREDLLSVLILLLIFIETVIGILNFIK